MDSTGAPDIAPPPDNEEPPVLSFSTATFQAMGFAVVVVAGWIISFGIAQWLDWNVGIYAHAQGDAPQSSVHAPHSSGQSQQAGDSPQS
ncbi:MAG: hypothetical protein Q4C87_11045 [Actinomycetaceae bacterium]|nr:hypothetical protein [Actinomycetaceae bacterium]